MNELFACISTNWHPGIGDPTWQGWSTTLMYIVVAAAAWWTSRTGAFPKITRFKEQRFWSMLAFILALLAVNKQLDLQSALTELGRCSAHLQGWYDQRRVVQVAFLAILAVGAVVFFSIVSSSMRGTLDRTGMPAVGLAFVLGFVMMRAVGFHYIDWALGRPMLGVNANTVIEWIGPMLILAGAWRCRFPAPGPRRLEIGELRQ